MEGTGEGCRYSFVVWSYPIWVQSLNNFVADCSQHFQDAGLVIRIVSSTFFTKNRLSISFWSKNKDDNNLKALFSKEMFRLCQDIAKLEILKKIQIATTTTEWNVKITVQDITRRYM